MNCMIFWVLILVMLVAAVMCVLLPLSRKEVTSTSESRTDVYKGQLRELEQRGAVADEEERAQIGRRLLSVQEQDESENTNTGSGRASLVGASLGALIFIPAFTTGMYLTLGTPDFDVVGQASLQAPIEQQSVEQLVAAAEKQLEKNPDDLRGWTVVAGVYGRTSQFAKRENALRQIIRLSDPSASMLAELGEARTLANGGIVSTEALAALNDAIKLDPKNTKARAYLLLAMEQEGRLDEALAGWIVLKLSTAGQGGWEDRIAERVASLESRLTARSQSGPSQEQVGEAAKLPQADQQAMIEGMVAGLALRLEDEPDDIEGWLRLLRSYHVLGKREALDTAWKKSTTVFAEKPAEKERLMAAAKGLGYTVAQDGSLKGGVSQ